MRDPLRLIDQEPTIRIAATVAALVAIIVAGGAALFAADWPQFLGPTRNGVYTGTPIAESWPSTGPRVVWRKQVGAGFAGPAVAAGRVILFHHAPINF